MRDLKNLCHVLGKILYKIKDISRVYLPLCLLQALINSFYSLVIIYIPAHIIDALVTDVYKEHIVLLVMLSVSIPLILNVWKALLKHKLESLSNCIENELQLSVNMAMVEAGYDKLEDLQVHLQVQKLRDGQNMVGRITSVIRNVLGGIVQYIFGLLTYLPLLIKLVKSDQNQISSFLKRQPSSILITINSNTIIFLMVLLIMSSLHILIKLRIQEKKRNLVESFLNVERTYGYYVSLRADYEYGADIRLNGLRDMLKSRMEKYNYSERKMHFSIGCFEGISDMCLSLLSRL